MKNGQMEPVGYLKRCHPILIKLSLLPHLVDFGWSCTCRLRLPGDLTAKPDKYALMELGEMDEKTFQSKKLGVVAALQGCLPG